MDEDTKARLDEVVHGLQMSLLEAHYWSQRADTDRARHSCEGDRHRCGRTIDRINWVFGTHYESYWPRLTKFFGNPNLPCERR